MNFSRIWRAIRDREWGLAVLLFMLLLVGLLVTTLLGDRLVDWANEEIDRQGKQLLTSFIGSIWFPVTLYGFLAVVWAASIHIVRPRGEITAPPAVKGSQLKDLKFNSRSFIIEPASIDITRLKDTDAVIGFNFLVETAQWPLTVNGISGTIRSLGKEFTLPIRAPNFPLKMIDTSSRWNMQISQPVSPERAKELLELLLNDSNMVSFDFNQVTFDGVAHFPGYDEQFVAPIRLTFEVKGPLPETGGGPGMVLTAKTLVSQVYYDQYGNKKAEPSG